ncbi:hypothetical protein, conserved [Eimeria praecox]|uniref:B-block binding subunit of TFIIIC domain-containing protein n=1 Tax=Eimeria praecox TaxID=51316 RepID=U6GYY6_9EIME|nr:hypothetical protein, conserved [Eimeria praecox]
MQQENDYDLDPFMRALLWRSLYRCPDVHFTTLSSYSPQQQRPPAAAATEDAEPAAAAAAATAAAAAKSSKKTPLPWRDPAIPPDLPVVSVVSSSPFERPREAAAGDTGQVLALPADAAAAAATATAAAAADACREQQRQWLLTTCNTPGPSAVPLLLLTEVDAAADKTDLERRAAEIPFQILRNIASHKEHGQWQYCLAQELQLEPKTVFHHLKPLYRDELICHMQLAIPPTHKLGRGGGPSRGKGGPPDAQGPEEALRGPGGPGAPGTPGASPSRGAARTNLTVSALLWSSAFFSPLRLPTHLRGLVASPPCCGAAPSSPPSDCLHT